MSEFGALTGVSIINIEKSLGTTATALPTQKVVGYVVFSNPLRNTGNIVFGGAGVTFPDGTDNSTAGTELIPGEKSVPFICEDLNMFFACAAVNTESIQITIVK